MWKRASKTENRLSTFTFCYENVYYYVINGEVRNHTFTESGPEGKIVYSYPTASFRIPSDWFESGQIVNVMVDLGTEEIV